MTIKILLDTNFLIYCAENKINYPEEIDKKVKQGNELLVFDQVINELKDISCRKEEKFKNKKNAEISLKLLELNKIKIIKSGSNNADNSIVLFAKENPNTIICTLDRNLKKRVDKSKTKFIILRGKGFLDIQ